MFKRLIFLIALSVMLFVLANTVAHGTPTQNANFKKQSIKQEIPIHFLSL